MIRIPKQCAAILMALCASASVAQAVDLPYGYGVRAGKNVELKARVPWLWEHWQGFAKGYVASYSTQYQEFNTGAGTVIFQVKNDNLCHARFNLVVSGFPFTFGGDLNCANFFKDDEHNGGNSNNGQGVTMVGNVYNHLDGSTKFINITLWPKREDRTRVTLSGPGAMGTWELEVDVDEG